MNWEDWIRAWQAHSKTLGFRRRVDTAKRVAESGARHGKMYCSLSGGKDSVAMNGILDEVGLTATVPSVHAFSALDYPDTIDVVHDVAERLNLELIVIEPDNLEYHVKRIAKKFGVTPPQPGVNGYDEWDLIRACPPDGAVTDYLIEVSKAQSSPHQLVSFMYENQYDGAYVGIRADESAARKQYARRWGYAHGYGDGTTNVCPLLAWSGLDVYAYLVSRDLPIHPYYRKAFEVWRGEVDSPMTLRVCLAIPPAFPSSRGSASLIARVYPEFWRKLTMIRPEMRAYE